MATVGVQGLKAGELFRMGCQVVSSL